MRKTLALGFEFSHTRRFSSVNQAKYEGDLAQIATRISLGNVDIAVVTSQAQIDRTIQIEYGLSTFHGADGNDDLHIGSPAVAAGGLMRWLSLNDGDSQPRPHQTRGQCPGGCIVINRSEAGSPSCRVAVRLKHLVESSMDFSKHTPPSEVAARCLTQRP